MKSILMRLLGNRVSRNALWIIACKIVQSLFSLVITMVSARYLGPSNYGVINYANSIAAFVVPIMELGLSAILVQELILHPEKEGEIMGTSLVLSLISAALCILGITAFVSVANHDEPITILVCVLYSFMLLFEALELMRFWYQAKYLAKYTSIVSLIAYIAMSAYKVFLLLTDKGVVWFAISYSFDYAIISFLLIAIYKKRGEQKFRFNFSTAKRLLSKGRHYIIAGLMVSIFAQTDRIMLKLMTTDAICGYYSAAITCASLAGFVFQAIVDSARPAIYQSKKDDQHAYEKNLKRLYCVIIYASLLTSLATTVFAKWIVQIIYGSEYAYTATILQVSVWYMTFSFLGVVRNIWMLAEDKQKYLWIVNLCGALGNIFLNALLIPYFDAIGAAIASVFTQFFSNVIVGFIIKPLRDNNKLMIQALNPRLLLDMIISTDKKG